MTRPNLINCSVDWHRPINLSKLHYAKRPPTFTLLKNKLSFSLKIVMIVTVILVLMHD